MGLSKLFYALRICSPQFFTKASVQFDVTLKRALDNIVIFEDLDLVNFNEIQVVWVYAVIDASLYAFVASRIQFIDLQIHILRRRDIISIKDVLFQQRILYNWHSQV